jgi:hypothetical protein
MTITDVANTIARIEQHRQALEKEGGAAAACNEALRRLHELLEREHQALQTHGDDALLATNIEAVKAEIERVKKLAATAGKGVMPKRGFPQGKKHVGPSRPHGVPRTKLRRTMGRSSGR